MNLFPDTKKGYPAADSLLWGADRSVFTVSWIVRRFGIFCWRIVLWFQIWWISCEKSIHLFCLSNGWTVENRRKKRQLTTRETDPQTLISHFSRNDGRFIARCTNQMDRTRIKWSICRGKEGIVMQPKSLQMKNFGPFIDENWILVSCKLAVCFWSAAKRVQEKRRFSMAWRLPCSVKHRGICSGKEMRSMFHQPKRPASRLLLNISVLPTRSNGNGTDLSKNVVTGSPTKRQKSSWRFLTPRAKRKSRSVNAQKLMRLSRICCSWMPNSFSNHDVAAKENFVIFDCQQQWERTRFTEFIWHGNVSTI